VASSDPPVRAPLAVRGAPARHGGWRAARWHSWTYRTTLLVLFIVALMANRRLAGPSPIIWTDTFNDEEQVQACLHDECPLTGMGSSVPGLSAGVVWLELRTALCWAGLDLDGAHLVLETLNALAVVLVFHLTTQLGGAVAGGIAVWLFLDHLGDLLPFAALHNVNLLVFLGAVLALACTAVVARPGAASVALAALVAAISADVHLACLACGASVVWVALAAPRRDVALALFGATVFVVATVLIAPPMWIENVRTLIEHPSGHATSEPAVRDVRTALWLAFGVAAWLIAGLRRDGPAFRRRALGPVAVVGPGLALFMLAPHIGINPYGKYLVHLKAAGAVAAALPIAAVLGAIVRRATSRRVWQRLEELAPVALAIVIAVPGGLGVGPRNDANDLDEPTVADLRRLAGMLHDEHGWDAPHVVERMKSPDGSVVNGLLRIGDLAALPPVAPDLDHDAVLLTFRSADLPAPLPPNWSILHRAPRRTAVLILVPSRIDWDEIGTCVRPVGVTEWSCRTERSRLDPVAGATLPGMPPHGTGWQGTLRLSFALHPATDTEILIPRRSTVCQGRIVSVPPGSTLAEDGRRAVIAPVTATDHAAIVLEWEIGSPACLTAYDGLPPFFVAADTATLAPIAATERRYEGSGS
jgi:hypothetical protein